VNDRPDLIEGLLATGEEFSAPASAAAWFGTQTQAEYNARAFDDVDAYWRERAGRIVWDRKPSAVFAGSIDDPHWFSDGRLNATVSCLDRHAASHPDAIAYDYFCENGISEKITYAGLLARVNQLANALDGDGVKPGDRVCIYMPLAIEGIVAMLACARIGAVHSVIYAGLGATALRDRIADAQAQVVIVADVTYRRGKAIDLKGIVDDAVRDLEVVRRVVVWRREATQPTLGPREVNFEVYCDGQSTERDATIVDAEHPLFMLYTSGTTGKPKGVVMTHGGYLVGTAALLTDSTGLTPADRYWCTSDIGWIVGHSLIVYGPLANRLHCYLREGAPDYPTPASTYQFIATHTITKFYTAPTLARMLMRFGAELPAQHDLTSLQAIFCAGEPLNPEAWHFLWDTIGKQNVAVCNQWWQTEIAAPALGYFPTSAVRPDRSGKALGPVVFAIVDQAGNDVPPGSGGFLIVRQPLPHMFAGIYGDDSRYAMYFNTVPGAYFAGDVATMDAQGYISVLGRADDVLNVAGHRIATADVESALVSHHACGEAGVIGKPDPIKSEVIKAFVVLRAGFTASDELRVTLIEHVRYHLGPIGAPAELEFVAKLPKTRSGKIMRRLLKAQETGEAIGDITTLEE
jgi:acetyl-CoA synthetase